MKPNNSVFLRNGSSVAVLGVFPRLGVARVRTADGQTPTIKLSELGLQATAVGGSPQERRPSKGNIAAGVPHEALAGDSDFRKMQPRIQDENQTDDPVTFIAEAIQDIWANESPELSAEEQHRAAEKYWEEAANKTGNDTLHRAYKLWHHLQNVAKQRYNLTETKDVMNEKAFEALQRVIARRVRPQSESVQGTDQPAHTRVLPQHRGRQETGRDSGESEEPRTDSGTGRGEIEPEDLERPPSTSQSVFLLDGRKATIQFISPAMKVARVRTADGQTRTIKLSELQPARTRPIADMRNVPEMGHNMTADAPSVRRAQAEAKPVRGQTPTIKVKQEPAEIQAALTQPPAPVRAADAARVGQRDPQSGRTILQPSNDLVQNERLANQAAPELNTRLSRVAARIVSSGAQQRPGLLRPRAPFAQGQRSLHAHPLAKFDRLRPQKGLKRLQEKVADGKPANTIGDNLAAQIVAPSVKAKNQIIAELHREFPVISVDDKFLEPREKAGYPSTNVQVRMRNGSTAEVQIVAPEIQKKTDLTHRLYTLGRNYPENSPERAYYWNQAAAIHMQALEEFKARNAQQPPIALEKGQRVVLKDGKTGKIVGFSKKFDRVSVKTHEGTRTVKPGEVTPLITRMDSAAPARTTLPNNAAKNAAAKYEAFRQRMKKKYGITDFSEAEKTNSLAVEKYKDMSIREKELWYTHRKELNQAFAASTRKVATGGGKLLGQAGNIENALATGNSIVIAEPGKPAVIEANDAILGWLRHRVQDIDLLGGGTLDPTQTRKLINDLRFRAESVRLLRLGNPASFERLADQLETHGHPTGGTTIIRAGLNPRKRALVILEEQNHVVSSILGKGNMKNHVQTENLARLPEARKGWVDLAGMGYGELSDAELVCELGAKLTSGHTDGLTLTGREEDHFLDAYFIQLIADHGIDAPRNYWNIACPRARASIKRVVAAHLQR